MKAEQANAIDRDHSGRIVLLAEDDEEMRTLLSQALRGCGYVVAECANGIQLVDHLQPLIESQDSVAYDLIISDIRMPGVTGMEVVAGLAKQEQCPPIILITAFGEAQTHSRAHALGVRWVLDKPFDMEELLDAVRHVIEPSPKEEP